MKRWIPALVAIMMLSCANVRAAQAENGSEKLQALTRASARRIALAREVAFAKWDTHTPVEDIQRENQVIEGAISQAKLRGLDEQFVAGFFRAQIEANKVVQYRLLADWYRAGKAPDHSPVNLKDTIRPQLDALQISLLDELSATVSSRHADTCHAAIAAAVGSYVAEEGKGMDPLDSIALDRSLSSFCAH